MLDFDDALEEIGEFGRFQIINYILLCLPLFFSAGNSLTYVFTAGVPNYRCYVEGCDNEIYPNYNEPWVENAIPSSSDKSFIPEQCQLYTKNSNSSNVLCTENDYFSKNVTRCSKWVFEDNEHTIAGEWNIMCVENQWKLSLVGTVHFIGILLGTVIFGILADKFGRKIVFVFCIVLMSITGIAQAVSGNYITFQVFVLINALGTSGVYPLAFILGVELVGKSKREMSGVILNYFYAVGEASVGLIAYLSKDWKVIQLAVSIPPVIFIFYYWIVPESVRWLLAHKRTVEAGKILKQAAKMNKVHISKSLMGYIEEGVKDSTSVGEKSSKKTESSMWLSCKQLLRSKTLIIRSLLLFYIWAANAFVYYGLSVNSTTLGGNKYLNFALVCLVEIPGYSVSWWAMNKLGRRKSFSASMILCGLTCVTAAFVPDNWEWATIVLFLAGKLGITSSFGIAYIYSAELYPTVTRSAGVGACSTIGRLGAIVAPFAPLLSHFSKPLPLLLFSGVSLIAGVFALFLPETLGTKLPDTVQEAEQLKLVNIRSPTLESPASSDRET